MAHESNHPATDAAGGRAAIYGREKERKNCNSTLPKAGPAASAERRIDYPAIAPRNTVMARQLDPGKPERKIGHRKDEQGKIHFNTRIPSPSAKQSQRCTFMLRKRGRGPRAGQQYGPVCSQVALPAPSGYATAEICFRQKQSEPERQNDDTNAASPQ